MWTDQPACRQSSGSRVHLASMITWWATTRASATGSMAW